MKKWKKIQVHPEQSILEVMQVIDTGAVRFAIVTDEHNKLLGTITDGDIRRAILGGINLNEACQKAMNANPTYCMKNTTSEEIFEIMRSKKISHMPIIDHNRILLEIRELNEVSEQTLIKDNPVVLMAGGLGTRLGELTANCPKPLLKIGNKPILQIIIENFKSQGFHNFYISVNYKSEMIEEYFKAGEDLGVSVNYLREGKKLGTAGALSLISENVNLPMIVMNGDLLTKINFTDLLHYHCSNKNEASMCIRQYEFQVPFGVIDTQDDRIVKIDEKPIHQFFVNAGIYVLNPEAIKIIPLETAYDMPHLFNELIAKNKKTGVFPIHEYWLDVGHKDDFEKAQFDAIKL
ncbi:MAG: nucleotidyltransferase family protein [Bacteriovorax sp.]|jgi:dTDP-glucose pyrophosphorylase